MVRQPRVRGRFGKARVQQRGSRIGVRLVDDLEPLVDDGTHEHGWDVESRHATSEGTILYVVCADCGVRRIDLSPRSQLPPIALTVTVQPGT